MSADPSLAAQMAAQEAQHLQRLSAYEQRFGALTQQLETEIAAFKTGLGIKNERQLQDCINLFESFQNKVKKYISDIEDVRAEALDQVNGVVCRFGPVAQPSAAVSKRVIQKKRQLVTVVQDHSAVADKLQGSLGFMPLLRGIGATLRAEEEKMMQEVEVQMCPFCQKQIPIREWCQHARTHIEEYRMNTPDAARVPFNRQFAREDVRRDSMPSGGGVPPATPAAGTRSSHPHTVPNPRYHK